MFLQFYRKRIKRGELSDLNFKVHGGIKGGHSKLIMALQDQRSPLNGKLLNITYIHYLINLLTSPAPLYQRVNNNYIISKMFKSKEIYRKLWSLKLL